MQRLKPLAISALILLLTSACGYRGPLYLPEAEKKQPGTVEETDEQKEQDENGKNTRT